jgi:hypothetical protein
MLSFKHCLCYEVMIDISIINYRFETEHSYDNVKTL